MGRTPWMTQTDLFLSAQLPLPHHLTSALEVNVLNVFDQKAVTSVYQVYSAQNLPLSDQAFFAGFNADAVAAKVRKDPRFGSPVAFQAPREITMTAKFVF